MPTFQKDNFNNYLFIGLNLVFNSADETWIFLKSTPQVMKTSLSMVGMGRNHSCHCFEKYRDYGQIVLSICEEPQGKSYEIVLTFLHPLTCHEVKNFFSQFTKLSGFLTALSFKSACFSKTYSCYSQLFPLATRMPAPVFQGSSIFSFLS